MCVFCKIVNGEIPGFKLYENDLVIAILDISQTTKGHTDMFKMFLNYHKKMQML